MENRNFSEVITIDGPAGSGKSTTARLVAQRLGFLFLDTGAMYRAFTLKALRSGVNLDDETDLAKLTNSTIIRLIAANGTWEVLLDGETVTREIRNEKVSRFVASVAVHPAIRHWMVNLQRQFAAQGQVVAEGRDVGTVVFPTAGLKIFLIASLEERARRRLKDYEIGSDDSELQRIMEQIKARDNTDETRNASPLKKAPDAIEIDTTNLSIEQQVELIIREWQIIQRRGESE